MGDDLDILFATPPAGFIAERKRIVAALKAAGRKDDAKAVDKIPRPSLAVWTVNRIAQLDPKLVRRLGAITERLQKATGPEYGAAAAEHRQVLGALRDRAGEVLEAAGQEVGPHIVQRVVANLRAAAGGAETRATLERGRLERDVDGAAQPDAAAGLFGAMAASLTAGPPAARARATPQKDAGAKAADAKASADAKAQERARAKEVAAAEREVKRLRDAAAAGREDVDRAERAVAAARKQLAAAEGQLATARKDADAAADALAGAEAVLARAMARR